MATTRSAHSPLAASPIRPLLHSLNLSQPPIERKRLLDSIGAHAGALALARVHDVQAS